MEILKLGAPRQLEINVLGFRGLLLVDDDLIKTIWSTLPDCSLCFPRTMK
jgi:hypothetical protein